MLRLVGSTPAITTLRRVVGVRPGNDQTQYSTAQSFVVTLGLNVGALIIRIGFLGVPY